MRNQNLHISVVRHEQVMKIGDGQALGIWLFLMCYEGKDLTNKLVSEHFHIHVREVEIIFKYLLSLGVITEGDNEYIIHP